jgi:hypothetical protein
VLAGRALKLLPEGNVLRQQINHAAQALERCQGFKSQRSLVCLGTRRGSGGELGWDLVGDAPGNAFDAPTQHLLKYKTEDPLLPCLALLKITKYRRQQRQKP